MQRVVWHTMWQLLTAGIWGTFESTEGEVIKISMAALRGELFSRYKAWRGKTVTRVSKLNLNMLGTRDSFGLRAKAMES